MDTTYRKILVPVDLDRDRHRRTLATARRLRAPEGEIVLLHVIEEVAGLSRDEDPEFYERLERTARDTLEALREALGEAEQVRTEVVYGSRASEILRWTEEEQPDLIVLSSHPIDPADHSRGIGSLSYGVAIFAPCSVLLVK